MVSLQIRDVPDGVRDVLASSAAARGQSLQAYLLELVRRDADLARNRTVMADLSWSTGSTALVADVLASRDAERARA